MHKLVSEFYRNRIMTYKLFFAGLAFATLLAEDFGLAQLVLIATKPEDAVRIATLIPEDALTPAVINKIRPTLKVSRDAQATDNVKKALRDEKAKLGTGGGAAAGGMTKAEAEKLIKDAGITVQPINSKADAKAQLVTFFDANSTGGKLLTEIYGANGPQKTVVAELQKAAAGRVNKKNKKGSNFLFGP